MKRAASVLLAAWFGLAASIASALPSAPQNGGERQYQPSEISEANPLPDTAEDAVSALSGSRFPGVIDHLLLRPIGNDGQQAEPKIHINYPSTGQQNVDADIRTWVTNLADIFAGHLAVYAQNRHDEPGVDLHAFLQDDDLNAPERDSSDAFELWGDYSISRPSENGLSVTFEIWNYTGDGQNNLDILTLNYNTLNGQRLHVVDIFENPELALSLMSSFSRRQLEPRLGAARRARMLQEGTEPLAENFSSLTLTPEGICINFQPWQVAPWEAGIQKVEMPLSELLPAGPLLSLWNK